ncbi:MULTISPECIES: TrkA family potassium uptake protein [Cyanophyceae]|uniref:TrkA family potassium uptake protein n=1 Tax=Thermoleptolyngbya oregonensis NK1-22 TaxID=2547457 RepID=A0AA96Y581_9CYAN|nr:MULTISPECIES: TrkA family potassium uptake protein [Cyanophyceae]MBF2085593.1 TrkA family potassium uptake protein [Thermoleptolyngbya sp. C42_A2020_037]WOB43724.1 TrkA family potassium uptake protein [Thermoleptolyngbya oregonensis NK1-22]BAU40436.1 Trk system potassium uptake protein TrkA [Leptolyngbya sp. O-77]
MYVLIGGAGVIGISLAQTLVELGHTVALVDIDPNACRYAREQIGAMAFEGSAVSTEVLLEAGIRKADAIAAVLREDALNLAMVTLAKHYGVPQIVVRMRHRDFAEPYRIAGATTVVNAIDLAVSTMANAIEYPQVESIMHFDQGQIEILKLHIPASCRVVGRSLAEIAQDPRFPRDSLIIGYQPHHHENLVIPKGSTVLEAGSTILMATKPGSIHQAVDFIEGCPTD